MTTRTKLNLLAAAAILLIIVFMTIEVNGHWDYVLPRRAQKILAILITGICITFSTLIFQTITNNRILTPSIIGLDSLYMLFQTAVVFGMGSTSLVILDKNLNFGISVCLMIAFSGLLFKVLFKREGNNLYFLLLIGIIFGTLFESMSSFMQVLIDPDDFLIVQNKMFASFNNVHSELLIVAILAIIIVGIYFAKFAKVLDVLSLGREHAVNLGVNYDYVVKRLLIIVSVLVSIATALVGPITFLGLLVVNVAYEFLKTYRHRQLLEGGVWISVIALIGGLLLVERVFTFSTTISVIVNFIGGVYFIYLLLRHNKA